MRSLKSRLRPSANNSKTWPQTLQARLSNRSGDGVEGTIAGTTIDGKVKTIKGVEAKDVVEIIETSKSL